MKTKASLKNKIEHRGYDVNATKNFDLELKMVKAYNRPTNEGTEKSDKVKSVK